MNSETAHQTTLLTGWRTASYSQNQGGNCVEIGASAAEFGIRDTKQAGLPHPTRPVLIFSQAAACGFLRAIHDNSFGPNC